MASAAQLGPSLAGLARRVQQFIEPLFGDPAFFPSHFPNRFTGLICLFHQRRGSLITELWSECRSHGKRLLDVVAALCALAVIAVMVWFGSDYAYRGRFQTISGLESFSMTWAYLALPVGAMFSALAVIGCLLDPRRQELETAQ